MPLASIALLCLVIAVPDGDTLRARCGHAGKAQPVTVRLSAVDAPERAQPYGRRARQALAGLVHRKEVELACVDTDRYGRRVCKVMVAPASAPAGPRTLDAGLSLVSTGMAWWYTGFAWQQSPQERGQYEFAQAEAKAKRAGLWRDARPVPPWRWRQTAPRSD